MCGLQLSLRTFHFDQENDPDVYCKAHVPKLVGTIDADALGVKSALNAPKLGSSSNSEQVNKYINTIVELCLGFFRYLAGNLDFNPFPHTHIFQQTTLIRSLQIYGQFV